MRCALFLIRLSTHTSSLFNFAVQVPDAVTEYFMGLSGYQCTDPRVTRIASLAAHKFVADLTNDALKNSKQRTGGKGRLVLTTEDLTVSAREYGIHIRKPAYFADLPTDPNQLPKQHQEPKY